MTAYLLDTDALIDYSKGAEPATSSILSWINANDVVSVCPITVAEFYAGLTPELSSRWKPFIASLPYWPISRDAAMQAGQYRFSLAQVGFRIATTDALLAAIAISRGATLVTGNVKDFRMRDLSIFPLR